MGGFDVRWLRLAVVAGAIAGSALVSSGVMATDELPPIDELELSTITDVPATVTIVVEAPPDIAIDDIDVIEMVIEMVIVEDDTTESEPAGNPSEEPEAELPTATPLATPLATSLEHEDVESGHEDGHGGSGHQGGSGGGGNPYLMSFEVLWLDPDGRPLGVLDAVLPDEWRSLFELSADSATGRNMPTSATCTYPDGSDVLTCVFDNPGHRSGVDGLVIPARPTATYTVTVTWPSTDWTIEGADDAPYSARDLCPRGGGGGGGHDGDDGHGGGDGHDGDDGHDGHDGDDGRSRRSRRRRRPRWRWRSRSR
jgi:hypothetical protein